MIYRSSSVTRREVLDNLQALHLAVYSANGKNIDFQRGHLFALLAVAESMGIRQEFWQYLKTIHADSFFQLIRNGGER